jgi:hypothetical protein
MNGRDVPDLLTGLQDALNVAHNNDSPSTLPAFYTPTPLIKHFIAMSMNGDVDRRLADNYED